MKVITMLEKTKPTHHLGTKQDLTKNLQPWATINEIRNTTLEWPVFNKNTGGGEGGVIN